MTLSKFISVSLVAVAAVAATSAFAQRDADLPTAKPANTTPLTRAEVKAETAAAKKDGEMSQSSHANPVGAEATKGKKKTRAEVKAETAAAKAANGGALKTPKE
ncbi:DUF4148 domain-containing protein [Variovorax sp. HJSM1_2]|uniref:DUF4148 domain-containing protein n=1 Tax=Variovorax sp. HJSM1_2 TaxID=3366263 RepID=UPI003BC4D808